MATKAGRQQDKTEARILEEIERIDKEISELTIKRTALSAVITSHSGGKGRPDGFVLTKAVRAILDRHVGNWVSVDTILQEIAKDNNGYGPDRKTLKVTLNDWFRAGKVEKDLMRPSFYRVVAKVL